MNETWEGQEDWIPSIPVRTNKTAIAVGKCAIGHDQLVDGFQLT